VTRVLPGGRQRPQNGLRVADEQHPLGADEERPAEGQLLPYATSASLRARRHQGPEQPGGI
jgi:hypothetical protein